MTDGDQHLSGFDNKLWALHHRLVLERQCYTLFKYSIYNVREGKRGVIMWFVPRDHDECFEITQWLEQELASEQTEDVTIEGTTFPGTDVSIHVMEFSGVQGYVDAETTEAFTEDFVKRLGKIRRQLKPFKGGE